LVSRL